MERIHPIIPKIALLVDIQVYVYKSVFNQKDVIIIVFFNSDTFLPSFLSPIVFFFLLWSDLTLKFNELIKIRKKRRNGWF